MRYVLPRFSGALFCIFLLAVILCVNSKGAEVRRAVLQNGLRVVIVPDRLAPVVTTEINYLAGSNEAPAGFPGTAHALEHMMFRGSPGLSADQLAAISGAMGGEFNADTQQTVTQYFFTVPAEDLEVALHIEAVRMGGMLDSQELWEKERGAIEQEVAQDLSNPMYIFYTRLLAQMYAGTPYAHDALGSKPSFDQTTSGMLKEFHKRWYGPNNAILIIAGDVDPAATLALVKRLFGDIPARPVPQRPSIALRPLTPADLELDSDLPYGLAITAYRLPGYDSPDFAAGQVLADVLDSQRGNLYGLVTAGEALFAGFNSDSQRPSQGGVGYTYAGYPKGVDGRGLVARLKEIMAAYVKDGLPADLVDAAKRQEIAAAEFARNSIEGLAATWSQALAVEGRNSPDEDIEAIKKVTVADVNRVARQFLDNATATTAVLTPRPAAQGGAVASGFGGKESFAPQQVKEVALPAWAEKATAVKMPTMPSLPADFHLANGLRLLVLPSTISSTVSLYGAVRNNPVLQEPRGKDGVSDVLDELFSYGTTTLDRLAFQKALDEIAAKASAGTDFSLKVLAAHFDRGVELLADNLLHPALPPAAFKVVRQERAGAVAGKLQSPDYRGRHALLAALFPPSDPALRQATPETVTALRLDDVQAYYQQVFRPDLTTIVIIGDVTAVQAKAVIEKYFGSWKAAGPKPDLDLPPVAANRPSAHSVPDPSRVQDEVTLAQMVDITRASPDYYPLQVGLHVLSGAFYASRLYRHLREEAGLVYSVDARLDAGRTRSVLAIDYGCDPQNVSKARAMIKQDLRTMLTSRVSDSELQQAKMLLLRQIPLSRASVDGIGSRYLELVRKELALDEPQRAAGRYLETTGEQVQEAFARRIRPDTLVQVSLGPSPR